MGYLAAIEQLERHEVEGKRLSEEVKEKEKKVTNWRGKEAIVYFEGQHGTRERLIATHAKENNSLETKIQELDRQLWGL